MGPCIEGVKRYNSDGYCRVQVNGKGRLAHRVAYCTAHGLTLDDIHGMVVRHKCDNPPCINPEHLELGTHADNMRDKVLRGRIALQRGEMHYRASLTRDEVDAIRRQYATGAFTQAQLAAAYGISQGNLANIVTGKTWAHQQSGVPVKNRRRGAGNRLAKLTEEQVREIRRRCAAREGRQQDIAAEFGIASSLVSMINTRKAWAHVP